MKTLNETYILDDNLEKGYKIGIEFPEDELEKPSTMFLGEMLYGSCLFATEGITAEAARLIATELNTKADQLDSFKESK